MPRFFDEHFTHESQKPLSGMLASLPLLILQDKLAVVIAYFRRNEKWAKLGIALLWLATRALPLYWTFTGFERKFDYELPQIKKLLEYGFWVRKGAFVTPETGLLANPWSFNYTHHPYPIEWFFAGLYRIGGEPLVYAFVAGLGLVSCLMVYVILRRYFSAAAAWWAAVLFTVTQGAIEFDVNTDTVALGTIIWILVMLVVSRVQQEKRDFSRRELWLIGLAVFVAGQISWFALTVLPAVLIICLPAREKFSEAVRHPFHNGPWKALILGGAATLLIFLVQVLLYTPDGDSGDHAYLREQLGLEGLSRWASFPWMCCRMILSGPALWLGALAAMVRFRSLLKSNRLFLGAVAYLPTLLAVCLMLPGLLARNQHGFRFPLFPCAILVAFLVERKPGAWLKFGMTGLAIAGLLFCYAKVQVVNRASSAAYTLGKWISQHSDPHDLVLFNRKEPTPPVQSYDVEFDSRAGLVADRIVRASVDDTKSLALAAKPLAQGQLKFLFLRDTTQSVSEDLEQMLRRNAVLLAQTNLFVPAERAPVYKIAREKMRSWLRGGISGPSKGTAARISTNFFSLELYRLDSDAVNALILTNQTSATFPKPEKTRP